MITVKSQPHLGTPLHPGEVLLRNFLEPQNISNYNLAKMLHLTETTVKSFINGQLDLTKDLAIRLSRNFDFTPEEWMALQKSYNSAKRRFR